MQLHIYTILAVSRVCLRARARAHTLMPWNTKNHHQTSYKLNMGRKQESGGFHKTQFSARLKKIVC